MPTYSKACDAALAEFDQHTEKSRKQLKAAFRYYPPPPSVERILRGATLGFGKEVCAAMSNLSVRRFTAKTLMDLMLKQHDQHRADPQLQTFLMTAAFDAGICYEDAPEVDLASIQLSVRRVLQRLGLEGVCVFEVDVLAKKLPGERCRRLMVHVHVICWTKDASFKPVVAGKKLSESRYFPNMLGAPSFTFISRAMAASRRPSSGTDPRFANLAKDQVARSVAFMAQYLLKPPIFAKNRYVQHDGRVVMRSDRSAFRRKTALRMVELWSKISVNQAVFAVGPHAHKLVRTLKARVAEHVRRTAGAKSQLTVSDIARAWSAFFKVHQKLGMNPSLINHRTSKQQG